MNTFVCRPRHAVVRFLVSLGMLLGGLFAGLPASKADDAQDVLSRGQAAAARNDFAKAVTELSEAIRLDPKLLDAYVARAWIFSETGEPAKAVADYSAAIGLTPADAQLYCDRAICQIALGHRSEAIVDYRKAAELQPEVARYRGLLGATLAQDGRFAEAIEQLRAAIKLNPGDAGANYRPIGDKSPSADSLKHGQQQVERMIKDRPAMGQHAAEAAFLRDWAARKFAGEDLGEPIDWDVTPPRDSDAENVAPTPGRRGRIMLDPVYQQGDEKGQPRKFEELWAGAVFELHNINNGKQIVQLNEQARTRKLSKVDYVLSIWRLEHVAMQQTRAFYVDQYLPWAAKQKLATDPALWFAVNWETADEAVESFQDHSVYPWRPYALQYDWFGVQGLMQQHRAEEALRTLRQMVGEPQHPIDLAEVYQWIGRCQLGLKRYDAAMEALNQSLQLNPRNAESYRVRASIHQALQRPAEADRDLQKAKAL